MRNNSPVTWVLAGAFLVAGLAYAWWTPDADEALRLQLASVLHLPTDARFVAFRSPYAKGRVREVEAVVQFTPAQWDAYLAKLDDAQLWDPRGFTFDGTLVTAAPPADAVGWHEGEYAWISAEFAAFWVDWGYLQAKEHEGKPAVAYARAARSLCWAVLGDGEAQRVVSCREHKHNPDGLRFYVRAKLEEENKRLFAIIR